MAVILVDIWDAQSGSKAKGLINSYFNVSNHTATVQDTNINLGVSQYKDC